MKKILLVFLVFLFCPVPTLAMDKIDINTASPQQLDELVGVGPALAQRITDGRPYSSLDGLLNVKGIGEKTLQDIKRQGIAYVSIDSQTASTLETPTATIVEPPAIAPKPPIVYPSGIVINEILPAPEGPDETNEWIEIYNQNDTSVNLQGWKIKDVKGGTTTYAFTGATTVAGKGYIVLKRPQTKITLNNDEDSLNLLFPNSQIADSMSYKSATKSQSYNKTDAGWKWSASQTPGAGNIVGINRAGQTSLLKQDKSDISNTDTGAMASISNAIPFAKDLNTSHNPLLLFIVAVLIAISSGAVILVVKIKLENNLTAKTYERP
ncbi:MAG: hypothetical protein EXS52_01190 [Candidatus Staskawiczbacteria bacterium]|nr:hypothetical protein [Candidatus Staskawiczbacteria bacterium]